MRRISAAIGAVLLAVVLAACNSPDRTAKSAENRIAEFRANPNAGTQAAAEKALDELDAQVDGLAAKGDAKLTELYRERASGLRTEFQTAKFSRAFNDATRAIRGIGNAVIEAGKSIGGAFKNTDTNATGADRENPSPK